MNTLLAQLKTRPKILTGISIPLFFLLILAGAVAYSITQLSSANKWVNHTHVVLGQADEIVAAAVDMETGMRGFLLAGNEVFLEPYHDGEKRTFSKIE